ncbi:ABC transporter substrate-binding protein [Haloplasma contractile]|uniref:Spermidine-putrescine-binding protein n=1 Tax=Haloplasma contractile SSD-17B TaxID=1033810 RepID=F7PU03_9MOLU|nr:ABC transporter substrate-binding protein [Haloplasma contractile]ERJ12190.1 Spermidine-putrescine-binding protein [Haloplasma contractile SSD-17B]
MINKRMTIEEIVTKHPNLIETFESKGFKGLNNKAILKQVGRLPLETVLTNKKMNVDAFIALLNESFAKDQVTDVTLMEKEKKENAINISGLLPCPVRLPLLEILNEHKNIDNINYELKAAAEGLDWIKEEVMNAKTEDDLADVFISAGFDLFFEEDLMKKFKNQNVFKDYTGLDDYNTDFENKDISLKDPSGDYSMLAVVPAVFLVNKKELGDRPAPKTWKDLLDPMYEKSISLPVSDFDLFNAILIHLYKYYGEEAVEKLGKGLVESMHPAEMVKSDKRKTKKKPAITIMPYFFTRMALPGGVMEPVWPEDGAIISPIFMLTKKDKKEQVESIAKLFASKEVGEIFAHKGLFPCVNKEVDNRIEGKTFKWIGWDYINNNNIGEILRNCMELFEKGMN